MSSLCQWYWNDLVTEIFLSDLSVVTLLLSSGQSVYPSDHAHYMIHLYLELFYLFAWLFLSGFQIAQSDQNWPWSPGWLEILTLLLLPHRLQLSGPLSDGVFIIYFFCWKENVMFASLFACLEHYSTKASAPQTGLATSAWANASQVAGRIKGSLVSGRVRDDWGWLLLLLVKDGQKHLSLCQEDVHSANQVWQWRGAAW